MKLLREYVRRKEGLNRGSSLEFGAKLAWDGKTGGEVNIGKFSTLKLDMPVKFLWKREISMSR